MADFFPLIFRNTGLIEVKMLLDRMVCGYVKNSGFPKRKPKFNSKSI